MNGVTHRYADLGEVKLHYVEAGEGPLVILLHGFPEFWYAWRHQIPALVQAGFRVVAPDMRGFNLSDKPSAVAAYSSDRTAADVAALIRYCGEERATVVGHDWGAGVAWVFAMRYPEMLMRLVILNVPHPVTMMRGLKSVKQLLRSSYMFFFQLPWLPEALARMGNYAMLRRVLRKNPVRPGAFTDEDIARYVEALARPGALTGAINYYRALMRQNLKRFTAQLRRIEAPVLVIWGEQDSFLGRELAEPDPEWVPHARLERLPDASHWVQADQPERVNELLLGFLRS